MWVQSDVSSGWFCSSDGAALEHRQNDNQQELLDQPSNSRNEGRMKFMSLRLEAAEAFAERVNEDLLTACRRAEHAESEARKYYQTKQELTVRFRHRQYTLLHANLASG
jgi:hypothetical protein